MLVLLNMAGFLYPDMVPVSVSEFVGTLAEMSLIFSAGMTKHSLVATVMADWSVLLGRFVAVNVVFVLPQAFREDLSTALVNIRFYKPTNLRNKC